MGVAAPRPLARGQNWQRRVPQLFVLASEIKGRPLQLQDCAGWQRLGRFIAFLHRKGIYHSDLHPGNLRLDANEGFALLDVQSVFFLNGLPRFLRRRNVGRLLMHCPGDQNTEQWRSAFLVGYNSGSSSPMQSHEIVAAAERQLERRYRSRTRRCCKDSSEFMRVRGPALRGYQRRDFNWGLAEIQEAVRQGRQLKPERVFAFEGVCVKRHRRRLLHRNRCRHSWIMSRALQVRDIAVPRALAYLASGNTRYYLSEYLGGGLLLNDYLSSLTAGDEKRLALQRLARWIRHIHSRRIWQRDFKSRNVLFHNGRYHMLDLDSVRLEPRIGTARRMMNLAQLNASVSNAITLKDRLRFFHFYIAGARWPRNRRRAAYQKIWEISRGKNTAGYDLDLDKLFKSKFSN
jgi:tRNA A-37 threonylcarbamoyl transferase component Bud32